MYLLFDVIYQLNLKKPLISTHLFIYFFLCCDVNSSLLKSVEVLILEYTLYVLHLVPSLSKTAPRIRKSMLNYKVISFSNSEITITAQQPNTIKSLHKGKTKYPRKNSKPR